MRLINSTDFPDHFLRRMVSWCCKQTEYPPSKIREAKFTNTYHAYRGRAFMGSRSFLVRIGPADRYPLPEVKRHGIMHPAHLDRIEGLVSTTAHEIEHLYQYAFQTMRRGQRLEPQCIAAERRTLEHFREQRETLLAAWSLAPATRQQQPKPSKAAQRQARDEASLTRWQRKLKLAQTKIKKLKTRIRSRERRAAKHAP